MTSGPVYLRSLLDCATCSNDVPRETLLEKIALLGAWHDPSGAPAPVQSRHSTQMCPLRHFTCKSDHCQVFFAGLHIIFLNLVSLCASAKAMCKTDQAPRHFTRKACACQVLFADMRKIILIKEGLGAGSIIWYNFGQFVKIKLDTKTPRAAPRNSFTLFYN